MSIVIQSKSLPDFVKMSSPQFVSQLTCDLDIYLPSELDSEESLSYQSPEMLIRLFQINTPSSAHRTETHLFDPLTDDMQALSVLTDEDYASMNEEDFNTMDVTGYPWEQSTVVPHIPSELQVNSNFPLSPSASDMYKYQQSSLSPSNSPSYSNKIDVRRFNFIDEATGRERRPFLYEFIRLLLDHDEFSHIASYVDRKQGVFKLHKPKEIAQLWKQVKGRNSDNSKFTIF